MSKELVVQMRVPLPEDMFAQAKVIAAVDSTIENLKEDMTKMFGHDGYTLTAESVTKRGPRRAGAARPGRKKAAPALVENAAA